MPAELTNHGALRLHLWPLLGMLLRWVCPVVIPRIFLDNLGSALIRDSGHTL